MNLHISTSSILKRRMLCLALGLFLTIIIMLVTISQAFAASPESESGKHLLMVHDGEAKKGILTEQDTLGAALAEADIVIDDNDVTEPSLDEELVSGSYDVNIYRARAVTIVDGDNRTKVMSPYRTAKQIAKQADITLHDEDQVRLEKPTDVLRDGALERLVIERATEFTLVFYGKKTTSYTNELTVGEMLASKDITLGEKDKLSVSSATPIKAGMTVEIWREGKQTITEEEAVDFSVRQIQDANREIGYRSVKTPGIKGERIATYEVVIKNGKEVSRKEIKSVITKQPSEQVEIVGAKVQGPEEIIAAIRAAAAAKNIDAQRVLLIASCESGFNPRADSGYYKGIFQHDPQYWDNRAARYGFSGASYYDVDAQIGVSTSMMAEGGWSHWGCDPGPQ